MGEDVPTTSDGSTAGSTSHDAPNLPPLPAVDLADYEAASELLRALSAPLRLALVDLLSDAPRCVHELVDALSTS